MNFAKMDAASIAAAIHSSCGVFTIVSCVLSPEYVKNTGSRKTSVNGSSSCADAQREHAARHGGADQEGAEHRVQADDVGE